MFDFLVRNTQNNKKPVKNVPKWIQKEILNDFPVQNYVLTTTSGISMKSSRERIKILSTGEPGRESIKYSGMRFSNGVVTYYYEQISE